MNLLSAIIIGVSTNLDNLCAAMLIGVQRKRISILSNLMISLISGAVALVSSYLASFLVSARFSNMIGGILIIGIGIWTIISAANQNNGQETFGENLDLKKTIILGLALSINCMPVSFGAGATGLSPFWISLFIAIFSFLSLELGMWLGMKAGRRFNSSLINAAAGVLLVGLGLFELLA